MSTGSISQEKGQKQVKYFDKQRVETILIHQLYKYVKTPFSIEMSSCNHLIRDTCCQYIGFIIFQAVIPVQSILKTILTIQFSSTAFSIWNQLPFLMNEQRGPLDSELIIWTKKTYGGIVDPVSCVTDLFWETQMHYWKTILITKFISVTHCCFQSSTHL